MAVGDAISVTEFSVGNNGNYSIQPASGVEWVVTWLGGANKSGIQTRWSGLNDQMRHTWRGGNTSRTERYAFGSNNSMVHWTLTNSVYLRARNEGGATYRGAFCGIQTK